MRLALGEEPNRIYVEAKLLRVLGDNGKPNDNMLMHYSLALSAAPQRGHRLREASRGKVSGSLRDPDLRLRI